MTHGRSTGLALTLIQPWAHAIAHLGKWIENRGWCPPQAALDQRICIHAGAKCDQGDIELLRLRGHVVPHRPAASAVVATAVLAGWVRSNRSFSKTLTQLEADQARASEWYVEGQVAWVLRDVRPLSTPLTCKGARGLWPVPSSVRIALAGKPLAAVEPRLKTPVVHCRHAPYDVLIDRSSVWGNPFSHLPRTAAAQRVASREEAIARYEVWLREQPELVARVRAELRGKVLACWCAPLPCHGDVLARIANDEIASQSEESTR